MPNLKLKAKKFFDSIESESFAGTNFYRIKSTKRICLKLCDEIIETLNHLTTLESANCSIESTKPIIKEWEFIKEEISSYKE